MKWFIILIIFIFISCERNSVNRTKKSSSAQISSEDLNNYKKLVLFKGDTNAYKTLEMIYFESDFSDEFLYYSVVMANKFNNQQACYDVYYYMTDLYNNHINDIDSNTANIAIMYLLKAYKTGHHQAKDVVSKWPIVYDINKNQNQIIQILK